tara:strand:+ start:794 stop:1228 length:435 start_codon:yes stop_codon:yes gene_type:complete
MGGLGGVGKDVTPVFGAAPQPVYIADGPPRTGPSAPGLFGGGGGGVGTYYAPGGTGGPGGGGESSDGGPPGITPPNRDQSVDGVENTGGGGGGGQTSGSPSSDRGGNGGKGIVLVKEPSQPFVSVGGIWPQQAQYLNKKAGNWT